MKFKSGILHVGILALVAFGLLAATALSVSASHSSSGIRPFDILGFRKYLQNTSSSSVSYSTPTYYTPAYATPVYFTPPYPGYKPSPNGPCYPVGDVNNDRLVSAVDAQIIKQHIARTYVIPSTYLTRADVNRDRLVNAIDAQLIMEYVAGKITYFRACM